MELFTAMTNYSRFLELKGRERRKELASEQNARAVSHGAEIRQAGCRARSTKQRSQIRLASLKMETPVQDQTVELDSVET